VDFTLHAYKLLLKTLINNGYAFFTLADYLQERGNLPERIVILRHDVDLKPRNSLATAKIEHQFGVRGSYYFRMVPESYDPEIISEIASLAHEIGYHYETMDTVSSRHREEMIDQAYELFIENLEIFRKIADIKTVCMHGSPKSKFDNRAIWEKYSYRELGIIGEPYFDIDFNEFFYLTDTGRRWDGHKVSVRDKMPQQIKWNRQGLRFRSSKQIVRALQENRLPEKIMITVHPQRWNNSFLPWAKELVWQTFKNVVKRVVVSIS